MCHDCYKFRRDRFLLGAFCSCFDRLDCSVYILLFCAFSCLVFLLEDIVFFPALYSQV